jgi:hypothetical protein
VFGTGELITQARDPVIGETLEKMGRTTGFTRGIVYAEGYFNVDYDELGVLSMIGFAIAPLVDPTEYIVNHGDSGGVFYEPGTGYGVGHVVAGSWSPTTICYCTYLTSTLSEINVTLTDPSTSTSEGDYADNNGSIVPPYIDSTTPYSFLWTVSIGEDLENAYLFTDYEFTDCVYGKRSTDIDYMPIGVMGNPSCFLGDVPSGTELIINLKLELPVRYDQSGEHSVPIYIGHGRGYTGQLVL